MVALANAPNPLPADVVERFRRGDRAAFVAVYDVYAADLRPLVARYFASPFEREEATQEIWLHVHRVAGQFDPERGRLGGWLHTLAANRCKEILRARGRRPSSDVGIEDNDLATTDTPETDARRDRLRAAVEAFVQKLDAESAQVFRLSILDEMPHDECARHVGISARRCKYLRMKLLERAAASPLLRKALEELRTP